MSVNRDPEGINMFQFRRVGLAIVILAVTVGCSSGRKIVPVSGVVTVDDKPARNVIVSFQPLGAENDQNPGRGSTATTDENGRYSLIYDGERPGALTGKHRVRIWPQFEGGRANAVEGEADGGAPVNKGALKISANIPLEWNEMSNVEFDVPSAGTDQANFNIETKKPSK